MRATLRNPQHDRRAEHSLLGVGTATHSCLRSYEQGAHMRFVSVRSDGTRSLLAALASVSLFAQLCVSGCAVGPSYRQPATTLGNFHSAAALQARPMSAPTPALELSW